MKENNQEFIIESIDNTSKEDISKEKFKQYIKNIDDEETMLLKLQKQYRSGKIREEELTQKQINDLCGLYDKQIEQLEKSNEHRRQKILEYRKKLQSD